MWKFQNNRRHVLNGCIGKSGTLISNMIFSTTCDKYLLLFMTKSKQICLFSQKRGFNGNIGVVGYADSEYDIVNNI